MNIKVTLLALLAMSSAAFALPLGIDFTDPTYAPIDGLRGQSSSGGITFTNAFPPDLFFPGQPAAPFVYSSTLGIAIANGAAAQISANTYSGAILDIIGGTSVPLVTGIQFDGLKTDAGLFDVLDNTTGQLYNFVNPQGDLYLAFSQPEEMNLTISSWNSKSTFSVAGFTTASSAHVPDSGNTWMLLTVGVGALLAFSRKAVGRKIAFAPKKGQ
jgi:hypothetical protein